jgi:ubiquinol-cytochrome c reductase cytochrome b subunit
MTEQYDGGWTGALRRKVFEKLPPEQLLPDTQPSYVSSWIYVFGVLTLSAFLMVVATGTLLALKGAAWWHVSQNGHFVNSLHLWSVELFMTFMSVHLIGKFFMAAWRGRRAMTWITGAVALASSAFTALTGYLVQQNFDSQWIATQAKDGLNAIGVGAYFNTMDFGQMLIWHVALMPAVVSVLVVWHILLVRRHGVVPPLGSRPPAGPEQQADVEADVEIAEVDA